jgi:Zn-dependent protease
MSWEPEHFDPTPPTTLEPPTPPRPHWLKRLLAPVAGVGLLLWKLTAPVLIAVKNIKFLATGISFLVSVAAYATIWGWQFALGFTVLLFVHELGHVIQLRREGVPASAPLFIPFVGAVVGMKDLPKNAWVEAKVGLAGPVLGSIGAAVCLAAAVAVDSDLLRAIAYTAFFLNLFNLIPLLPLDGGRAAAAVHPAFWFVGLFAVAALYFWHHSLILLLIALLGVRELWYRWERRHDPESRLYHAVTLGQRLTISTVYLGLVGLLVLGMEVSYLHRTF